MSILMGGAHIDEHGNITGGTAGDQTGNEVCTRSFYIYSKGWDFVAIHPDPDVREKHAQAVEQACANDNVGYDQTITSDNSNGRNTLFKFAKLAAWIIKNIKDPCECDCSSLQHVAAICSGGMAESTYGSNGMCTSDMRAGLKAAGYKIVTASAYLSSSAYSVRGAIYVSEGHHTECALGNGSSYQKMLEKAGVSSTTSGTTSGTTGGTTTSGTTELDVDGEIGPKTTTRLQKVMGTTQDGTIDGQPSAGQKYWTSILSSVCKWIGGTSEVVFALQKFLIGKGYSCGSSGADGLLGKNTAMALQRFLIDSGYSCGNAGVDGYFGPESAKALQRWLNAQK